jgi:hypothetical protein
VTDRATLVFPAGMPSALAWARQALMAGARLVGASSLVNDPAQDQYPEWTSLPWISDPGFAASLGRCLTEMRLETVFTAHPIVAARLRELLPETAPNVRLKSENAWSGHSADYNVYRRIAARFDREPLELSVSGVAKPRLTLLQFAALVRLFQLTPGQCGSQKLEALAAVFRFLPAGDLVEIGSFWGRSAVALAQLARHYRIGKLLCVDPWCLEELYQGIPQLDALTEEAQMAGAFEGFRINMSPFAGFVNYNRARSIDAASVYGARACFTTEDFGHTNYTGSISLLHIDGNHALDAVRSDIARWRKWVQPGGWIVFDDYCWSFGDGPRIAADEFCREFDGSLANGFVIDGSLFLQVIDNLVHESHLEGQPFPCVQKDTTLSREN